MNPKCINCGLVNFQAEENCRRCGEKLAGVLKNKACAAISEKNQTDDLGKKLDSAALWFFKRLASALVLTAMILCGAYFSMIYSAEQLNSVQNEQVGRSIEILDQKGFEREVFLLRNTVAFRSNDNWFNVMTGQKDAYAATNFPVQIVTLCESFFTVAVDDTERAMILLHEARHLQGAGEQDAYEFVWRNRKKLGYTQVTHGGTKVWQNVFEATRQNAPKLFSCEFNQNADCTE